MDQLQRINAFLKLDVFIRELGLVFDLPKLLLDHLLGALRKRREVRAIRRNSHNCQSKTVVQNTTGGLFLQREQSKGGLVCGLGEQLT